MALAAHIPFPLLSYLPALPWTLFEATIGYRHGTVYEVDLTLMQQEGFGLPHPDAASVEIYSTPYEADDKFLTRSTPDFTGYSVRRQGSQEYENDKPVAPGCCGEEFTSLDERATPAQRARALNFALHCLTSIRHCNTPEKLRPPLTKQR